MQAVGERESIAIVEKRVVDQQMTDGEDIEQPEASIYCGFEFNVFRSMHPLEN